MKLENLDPDRKSTLDYPEKTLKKGVIEGITNYSLPSALIFVAGQRMDNFKAHASVQILYCLWTFCLWIAKQMAPLLTDNLWDDEKLVVCPRVGAFLHEANDGRSPL